METDIPQVCSTCSADLPTNGLFCGKCLIQFKCKNCESMLEKDYVGCVICGTPRIETISNGILNSSKNINTFRLHETVNERTIEATFSDIVGKDLAGILKDTSVARKIGNLPPSVVDDLISKKEKVNEHFTAADVINLGDTTNSQPLTPTNNTSQFLTLKAIAMKNLPASETEWVVVYAFYASNFGQETFTRQNIIEKYEESNRLSNDKKNGLSSVIIRTVKAGYINPITSDFSILDPGIQKAKEIIGRSSSAAPKTKIVRKDKKEDADEGKVPQPKKSPTASRGVKRLSNIDFEPTGKESLKSFYEKHNAKNDKERNLLFVYYMQEILQISEITFDHVYSCYDILDLKVSENLTQTVRNTSSKTGWIEVKNSILTLTVKGGNQIKTWNKAIEK